MSIAGINGYNYSNYYTGTKRNTAKANGMNSGLLSNVSSTSSNITLHMEVVETIFNTDKKAVERLRYYIERDAIICVLVRDVVDISMELNEIKAVMTLAAEHEISINTESRGYEPALISFE